MESQVWETLVLGDSTHPYSGPLSKSSLSWSFVLTESHGILACELDCQGAVEAVAHTNPFTVFVVHS